ncbi:hypothetical protein THAOC_10858 [Thalassiosira oceanica]|uniref:MYND-type domain-containing protein n=1 Tax=Thalassiosira oceanica TaxID=159749 RepID=K0SNW9_THAOC|nr:hypothetical protein THAOC_10858 [Thalassiosira oceanica]|eukprot:EJK68018.1 hypothetical protein THAOC_10858 [Thalassiosira oceanica]
MSGIQAAEACANCGRESSDAVKLRYCTACRLVKYCSVGCQKSHRKQHKKTCKKRAAELKDERLYNQGHERPEGDFCPICTLPIPIPMNEHSAFMVCCIKRVCFGCSLAAQKRGMFDCPFCRTPMPRDGTELIAMVQKRVDAKDAAALKFLGDQYYYGYNGLLKNVQRAIELWREAAELGSINAHFELGNKFDSGEGVIQDKAKAVQHWEMAAIQGDIESRNSLGVNEINNGNYERAVKHFLIAAKMGNEVALGNVNKMFANGLATREQYAEALKGFQDSVDEMHSQERDEGTTVCRDVQREEIAREIANRNRES